jgi:hypothetical protein
MISVGIYEEKRLWKVRYFFHFPSSIVSIAYTTKEAGITHLSKNIDGIQCQGMNLETIVALQTKPQTFIFVRQPKILIIPLCTIHSNISCGCQESLHQISCTTGITTG